MPLRPDFTFSQKNLQDYLDCPRRFQLRYIQRQEWPAIQSEPVLEWEQHIVNGQRFHRMVQQSLAGIPSDVLAGQADNENLARWWQAYRQFPPPDLPQKQQAEVMLSAPFAGFRLAAVFDLLAIDPGKRMVIVDWKTSQKRPLRTWLQQRLQTRIYPMISVSAACAWNIHSPWQPEQIEMMYWFSDFSNQIERFQYSQNQYQADISYITKIINEINSLDEKPWVKTNHEKRCRFCNYRSLCERGIQAGDWTEIEEEGDGETSLGLMDIDLDQIGEIAF
jgi:CRISPR/Cas system-associated exonuclease Cas4 (RecB family)